MVGKLASPGEEERSADAPSALWDSLEGLWEDLGLPERPLWNVAGAGRRPVAEKVRLAALPIGLLAAACGFVWLVVWLGAWMNAHWGVYAVVPQAALMLVAVCGAAVARRRRWEERRSRGLRMTLSQLDAVSHQEFETVVRDLMRRDGFTAEHVGRWRG